MAYRGSIIQIIAGIFVMFWSQTNSDELLRNVLFGIGIFGFFVGIFSGFIEYRKIEKKKSEPRPICSFCGYIALDERELHNHQITCEKKKQRESENS